MFDEKHQAELGSWRVWRHIERLRLLDAASLGVELSGDESDKAWKDFCRERQIDAAQPKVVPPEFHGLPVAQLRSVVLRDARIAKWKEKTFGPAVADHFAKRRSALDRVVYSMIRVDSPGLARELGFRLTENEAGFAELARDYSAGEERFAGGIMGPVSLGTVHPALARVLSSAKTGDLLGPIQVAEWLVLAKVEAHLAAVLDEAMRQQMVEELTSQWLENNADREAQH